MLWCVVTCADVSNLWAVGWSEVPFQLFLLQLDEALRLGLLLLELLGDRLQFLWVQLGIQGTHLDTSRDH